MKTIYRRQIANYLDIGASETESFEVMGVGFESLDEEPGAKSESTCYIHESTSTSTITQYETKFPYSMEGVSDNEVVMSLYKTGRDHEVGADAERTMVVVDLYAAAVSGAYPARKFTVSNEVSKFSGEGGGKLKVEGTLNAVGDPVEGTFNVETKKFTATVAAV